MKKIMVIGLMAAMIAILTFGAIAQDMKPEREDNDAVMSKPHQDMPRMMGGMGRGGMQGRGEMMGRGRGAMMQRGGMMGNRGMMGVPMDKLDLSEEQRNKIAGIMTESRRNAIKMNADLQIAQVDLRELMRPENPDMNAIEAQLKKIANLQAGMRYSQIKSRMDVRNVLTEEQKAKLKELSKDRMEKATRNRADRAEKEQTNTDRPGMGARRGMRDR